MCSLPGMNRCECMCKCVSVCMFVCGVFLEKVSYTYLHIKALAYRSSERKGSQSKGQWLWWLGKRKKTHVKNIIIQ